MSGTIRIKICGVQDADDAAAAVDAGADLIGVNFVPESKRSVDIRTAEAICDRLEGSGVDRVALFRDQGWEGVERVLRRVDFDRVQLHGSETEEECELVELPVIKAIPGADVEMAEQYPGSILLLDHPSEGGGQGNVWDWSEASVLVAMGLDVILAGGLDPNNVGEAIAGVGDLFPWGVDVATGVEDENGRKSSEKMKAFVDAVRRAEEGYTPDEIV
ncbi:MAG: phosphoribosylanthranilate isomerase [Myxococcota bacterium]|nr:phosphoribosylanthranilate isomerase [Myxococcota bacterium]